MENNNLLTIGSRWGCLELLEDGSEYPLFIDSEIKKIEEEKEKFIKAKQNGEEYIFEMEKPHVKKGIALAAFNYKTVDLGVSSEIDWSKSIDESFFDRKIKELLDKKNSIKYKCKCRKCGKERYYNLETLQSKPTYCYKPLYCADSFTYSIKAQITRRNKRRKYENNDSIELVYDKKDVAPSSKYCEKWNEITEKKLKERAEEEERFIASAKRYKAKNYDVDYVGVVYESFEVLECVDDAYEDIYTKRIGSKPYVKLLSPIKLYKKYRCRCYLCKNEKIVDCDRFNIYQPEYGYRGYWSDLRCDCHETSSFEWIVNKLLFENRIHYRVEFHFDDLYGLYGQKFLTFDFAVFNYDGSIKCLIECQGEQHYKPVEEFGGEKALEDQKKNDEKKRIYAREHNIPLIEIKYTQKTEEKIKKILEDNGVIRNGDTK